MVLNRWPKSTARRIGIASLLAVLIFFGCTFAGVNCGTFGFITMFGGTNPDSCDIQIGPIQGSGDLADTIDRVLVRCTPSPGPSGGYTCGQVKFITQDEDPNRMVPFSFPGVECEGGVNDPDFATEGCYVQQGIYRTTGVQAENGTWPVQSGLPTYMCASITRTAHLACSRFTPS